MAFIGGQQYAGNVTPYPLAQQQGKSVWHTEGPTANGDDTDIANVLVTAKDVHDSLTLGSHNAYITFEMMVGPDGPTVRGFAYGQFAKYVRPGFERVDAPYSPATNVYMSAYTGGNGTVRLRGVDELKKKIGNIKNAKRKWQNLEFPMKMAKFGIYII